MSDLISRAEAIRMIRSIDANVVKHSSDMKIIAEEKIKRLPVEFDKEKVVSELEKEKEIHTKNYNMSLYKDYPEIKQRYEQIQLVLDKAIEKVKAGGI